MRARSRGMCTDHICCPPLTSPFTPRIRISQALAAHIRPALRRRGDMLT
ncbi:hypothetical protein JI435_410880 [Parastagonospora nodorum SN15]|uniref:Uncharacterized protein n=1 Tax=Phaeosphaeria nodorum (strain SN15 / ATCC MYA-4574 / FGSC 10173) TaxID=321614 RepID=A0A7U2F2Y8_PHANO|nr:hypothetical protein JI435_410880 [Parastagonospora nodorum SN15]